MTTKRNVLILCTGNSARSQMAEGLLRHDAGERFEVKSAGVAPTEIRPEAIAVMCEIGIDISDHRSKSVDEFIKEAFDYVITVCDNANEQCPIFPGKAERIHWSFEDLSLHASKAAAISLLSSCEIGITSSMNARLQPWFEGQFPKPTPRLLLQC